MAAVVTTHSRYPAQTLRMMGCLFLFYIQDGFARVVPEDQSLSIFTVEVKRLISEAQIPILLGSEISDDG